MENENNVEKKGVTTTSEEQKTLETSEKSQVDNTTDEQSQDPIKKELERLGKKGQYKTEREKALFTKRKIEERLKQLDEEEGVETPVSDEDENTPVTLATLRKLEKEKAQRTALSLVESLDDLNEKELVRFHLQNTIRPSGNPEEDFKNARALVNTVKNQQILEEVSRKTTAKSKTSGNGASGKVQEHFEPTEEELAFMKAPFNLSKEQIIAARKSQ